jgi:AcrR family transcriptional regulator
MDREGERGFWPQGVHARVDDQGARGGRGSGRARPDHDPRRRVVREEVDAEAIRDEAVAARARNGRGRGSAQPPRTRVPLDADMIVDAAMAIADREGPGAMTMRKIAGELGVGVMSLYWHVPTKRDLEALVLERLMIESAPPDEPTGDWRTDLASIAYAARGNILRHEWMIDFFSSASFMSMEVFGHGFLRHIENSIRMTESLPFDFLTKMTIISVLDDFTRGATTEEIVNRRRWQAAGLTREEFQERMTPRMQELFAESRYPLVELFMEYDDELADPDVQFEMGLHLLLDGVAHRIAMHEAGKDAVS